MHRDCRTGYGTCGSGAVGQDRADDLVAEQHRFPEAEVADAAVAPVVEVGAADTAVADGEQGLAGAGLPGLQLLDPQVVLTVNHTTQHVRTPVLYSTLVMPPSTYRICPLTKSAAGDARNSTPPTRSSVRPQRPAGVRLRTQALNSSSWTRGWVSSVSM